MNLSWKHVSGGLMDGDSARRLAWKSHVILAGAIVQERSNATADDPHSTRLPPFTLGGTDDKLRTQVIRTGKNLYMAADRLIRPSLITKALAAAIVECERAGLTFIMPQAGMDAYIRLLRHGHDRRPMMLWPSDILKQLKRDDYVAPGRDGQDQIRVDLRTGLVVQRKAITT